MEEKHKNQVRMLSDEMIMIIDLFPERAQQAQTMRTQMVYDFYNLSRTIDPNYDALLERYHKIVSALYQEKI